MDALEESMASEGGPETPNPLTLGYSKHNHPSSRSLDQLLVAGQQQGLLKRQPVESGTDLTLASEEQVPRFSSALGDQVEAGMADRAGRLNLRNACCRRQRGQLPETQPNGLICMIAARSSN